jgi:hypothetical protein
MYKIIPPSKYTTVPNNSPHILIEKVDLFSKSYTNIGFYFLFFPFQRNYSFKIINSIIILAHSAALALRQRRGLPDRPNRCSNPFTTARAQPSSVQQRLVQAVLSTPAPGNSLQTIFTNTPTQNSSVRNIRPDSDAVARLQSATTVSALTSAESQHEPQVEQSSRPMIFPADFIPGEAFYTYQETRDWVQEMNEATEPGQIHLVNEPWQHRVIILPAGAEDDELEINPNWQRQLLPPLNPAEVYQRLVDEANHDLPLPPSVPKKEDKDQTASLDGLCDTCDEKVVNTTYVPCGHTMWCFECATRQNELRNKCPICSTEITSVLHLRGNYVRKQKMDAQVQTEP